MASVWKRLQRVNKRAAKFQYTASYHRVDLETTPKWKPNKLSIVWTRRSRRVFTEPQEWEPSLKDPLKGSVIFTPPENRTVAVTLFKDSRTNDLEDKDWTFVLEDVSVTGKRRRIASCALNMRAFASLEPSARSLRLPLDTHTAKVTHAALHVTLHCVLLKEGQATDEDMQSLASLLSVNNNSDIAVLEDLDEDDYTLSDHSTRQDEDMQSLASVLSVNNNWDIAVVEDLDEDDYTLSDHSTRQMLDLRQQMEEMTQSLTNSDIAATPNSVQSLKFDSRTPTAPVTPSLPSPATPTPTGGQDVMEEEEKELPKFASTPKFDDGLKGIVFKPKTVAKRNLKPLELKTPLSLRPEPNDDERTPTGEQLPLPRADRDKTPVQDLLEWCQSVTGEYKVCRVTNLTTSFRSGLAFCAIIHRFRPDLIDFSGLQPDDAEKNLRVALEASGSLGLPRVLCAADVLARPAPDRLAIMTYLFQLRAHFTGSELQVEQLGNDETESSYLVGRHDTDGSMPRELFSREVSARRSRNTIDRPRPQSQESQESRQSDRSSPDQPSSPTGPRDVRALLRQQSRTILGKVLSPAREPPKPTAKWFEPLKVTEPPPARPEKLMTRKELTDPFGSDEEEDPPPPPAPHINGGELIIDVAKTEQKSPTIELAITDPLTDPLTAPEPVLDNRPQPDRTTDNRTQPDARPLDNRAQQDIRTQPDTWAQQDNKKVSSPELPKPTPQLLSRHDELKERARQLLEATKREAREKDRMKRQSSKEKEDKAEVIKENGLKNGDISPTKKPMTEEERQTMLRERARKLIADARAGIVSPSSPLSPSRGRGPTLEIISKQSLMDEIAAAGGVEQLDAMLARTGVGNGNGNDSEHSSPGSRKSSVSPDRSEERVSSGTPSEERERRSPLQSFSALVDRLTPDKDQDETRETGSYIQSELEALEREQFAVDERAAALERQLRGVMESADNTDEEDRLMSQWFNLVNKKNALLRRQMQLNILEQEEDLSRRCELLARELRLSLGVDEWRKTPGQKRRERLLLQELLSAVNERDRLVQEMDEQEKAIADDDAIERNLSQVEIQRKNNCILQ